MYNSNKIATLNTGIWIDKKHALIIHLQDDTQEVFNIDSGIEKLQRERGEAKDFTRMGEQYISHERKKEEKLNHELKSYFQEIAEKLAETSKLYICGPAESRLELSKYLDQFNNRPFSILTNEACDSLTQNQIIARVKDFFKTV